MTKKTALLIVFAAPALLSACVEMAAVGVGAGIMAAVDRRTAGTQIEDEGIELQATIRINERFGDKAHVNVTSYNRSVLLTGETPEAAARAEIEKIVLGLPRNVRGVTNEIQVAGVASYTARASDATITGKVKARFLDANRFNPLHVKVVTEAGVVYLLGIVTEQESNEAVELARTTGGVRKVVKVFEYCKPSDEPCRPSEQPKGEAPKGK